MTNEFQRVAIVNRGEAAMEDAERCDQTRAVKESGGVVGSDTELRVHLVLAVATASVGKTKARVSGSGGGRAGGH